MHDEWSKIVEADALEARRVFEEEQKSKVLKQMKLKEELDAQVRVQRELKAREKVEAIAFAQKLKEKSDESAEQDRIAEEARRERAAHEKETRDAQVAEAVERRHHDAEARLAKEREAACRMDEAQKAQHVADLEKKRLEKQKFVDSMAENQRMQDMRRVSKRREIEEDEAALHAHAERLQNEERRHHDEIAKFHTEARTMQLSQITASLQEKLRLDEEKAARVQLERQQAEIERERKQREDAKKRQAEVNEWNKGQLARMKATEEAEEQRLVAERAALERQQKASQDDEEKRRIAVSMRNLQHRLALEEQMQRAKEMHVAAGTMTEVERRYNAQVLSKADLALTKS